jgi:hypothetical protein
MVAYSFKARFAAPILAGTKRQTIRADRRRQRRLEQNAQFLARRARGRIVVSRRPDHVGAAVLSNFKRAGNAAIIALGCYHE